MAQHELDPYRRRVPGHARSLLWQANTALARPLARFFGMLGLAPGQLSLQSLTVTAIGLLRLATGEWSHVVQGTFIVYGGLLLDRADQLLAQAKGPPPAWGLFLGLAVDRLVEASLIVGLAALLARGLHAVPASLDHPWMPMPTSWALVLAGATVAVMLLWRLCSAYGDVLALRTHLLVVRRLPGPSVISGKRQGVERLNRLFDRDLLVLSWLVGLVLAQIQLALLVLFAAHVAALGETLALFWTRRRDPEPQASRILGSDYP